MIKRCLSIVAGSLLLFKVAGAQNAVQQVLKGNSATKVNGRVVLSDRDSLPVTIIKGKDPGPVFTIIAGIHGFEYPPIIAVQQLIQEIDSSKLKGALIILPIANVASFYGRSPFVNPVDNKNLNTAFPGKENGTLTERIAYTITNKIFSETDIVLDIHGGDANEDLLPFICYYDNNNNPEETALAASLSEASGFENIVSYPYTLTKTEPALYAFKQAVQDGKAALSMEAGKLGNVQEDAVSLIKSGVYNILTALKMYDYKQPDLKPVVRKVYNRQSYIKSTVQGLFYSLKKAGDTVIKDELVGYVTDEFGNIIMDIHSPESGTVLYKIGTPPVNKNETVFCIGYNI